MVAFSRPMYHINEDDGPANPELVLSKPLSFSINVQVRSIDGSAAGKHASILVSYCSYIM